MTNHFIPSDAALQYPFADKIPAGGELFAMHEDVFWLRMPLPFALDHINLWLIRDGANWCAIDCGIDNDASRQAWQQIFTQLAPNKLSRVLATHCHPDHIGLSHWLCEQFHVPLYMSAGEYAFARLMSAGLTGLDNQSQIEHFQRHGLSAVLAQQMQARKNHYPSLVPTLPVCFNRLQDGELFSIGGHIWRIITGFGHAPEHVSLYAKDLGILISGDMILPRISTNMGVNAIEPNGDPLKLYLDSLSKFADLPEDTLVLPSHGKPFRGLHTRITQLREHHALRLAEVHAACITPQSAADIVPLMFRRQLDVHQLNFAMGESLAHLRNLQSRGMLAEQCGTDHVFRFTAV